MLVDIETSGRCALATLEILGREVDRLPLAADQARRVNALLKIAEEHMATLVASPSTPRTLAHAAPMPPEGNAARNLGCEASAAWAAASALRRATSPSDVQRCRGELELLAARSPHPRVQLLCMRALAGQRIATLASD